MTKQRLIIAAVLGGLLLLGATQDGTARTESAEDTGLNLAQIAERIPTLDNAGNIVGYVDRDALYGTKESPVVIRARLQGRSCEAQRGRLDVTDANGKHIGYAIDGVGFVTDGNFRSLPQAALANWQDCS